MCGILGLVLANPNESAAPEILEGCHYLQHRGQDACGIMTCEPRGRLYQCKGNGMVRDVFTPNRTKNLFGNMGIGHLRYPTAGTSANSEAQPFYVNSPYGLSIAHNGNLTNTNALKKYVDEVVHRHINTDSDSELLLNVMAAKLQEFNKRRINPEDIVEALKGVYGLVEGAFACTLMIAGYGVVGFRDANGIRPLVYGERLSESGMDYMFASENIALEARGFTNIKDVLPGQAVIITKSMGAVPIISQIVPAVSYSPCIFEYVYFARPDSVIDGISVYRSRIEMGTALGRRIREDLGGSNEDVRKLIDVVIPVPDTSNPSALSTATELGLPYREGFVKNRYVGRTFIMPNQSERRSSVRRKLNANKFEFHGKSVLLVDDSIVRGTTSFEIVAMAKEAGAKKVYLASCSPPIRYNHIYGIDLADSKALVAHNKEIEDVRAALSCDGLFYQTVEDLVTSCKKAALDPNNLPITQFEIGVFNGHYITGIDEKHLKNLDKEKKMFIDDKLKPAKSESDLNIYNSGSEQ
ncbi:amidophosphoribosyltransferase [Starmerella bacillaris]|uniref:Amidophosphoribosyltransferase n=1 Tax=Starmerella bacillaris TaxID=1247836 RepID=A0AAV5RGP5_STABA|nr:amidophosphoribosyltransferase [Starmerella bacillaris]